jgi:hypothetical protein
VEIDKRQKRCKKVEKNPLHSSKKRRRCPQMLTKSTVEKKMKKAVDRLFVICDIPPHTDTYGNN